MRRKSANCYIIAGPNGAGKTTFATEFLPLYVHCRNFINADLIARGLSPFDPDAGMLRGTHRLGTHCRIHQSPVRFRF